MTSDPAIIRGMTQPGQPSNLQGLSDAATIGGGTPPPDSLDLGCLIRFGREVSDGTVNSLTVAVPQTRNDLIIRLHGSIDNQGGASTHYINFNGDTGDNYWWQWFFAQEGPTFSVQRGVDNFWSLINNAGTPQISNSTSGSDSDFGVQIVAEYNGSQTPYIMASSELVVPDYRNADTWKDFRGVGSFITANFGGASIFGTGTIVIAGLYRVAAPVTSVTAVCHAFGGSGSDNYVAGSSLNVWGRC